MPCCHETSGTSPLAPTGTARRPLTFSRSPVSGISVCVTTRWSATSKRAPCVRASKEGRIAGLLNSGKALATWASSRPALTRQERSIPAPAVPVRAGAWARDGPAAPRPASVAPAPSTKARRGASISASGVPAPGLGGAAFAGSVMVRSFDSVASRARRQLKERRGRNRGPSLLRGRAACVDLNQAPPAPRWSALRRAVHRPALCAARHGPEAGPAGCAGAVPA